MAQGAAINFSRRIFCKGLIAMLTYGRGTNFCLPTAGIMLHLAGTVGEQTVTWWERQGVAISPTQPAEQGNVEEPHAIYDTDPVILTEYTHVFKMWYGVGGFGNPVDVCYAESADGLTWTKYASNPVIEDFRRAYFLKSGSTYYGIGADVVAGYDHYDLYSSSDGVSFSLAQNSILAKGASGQWDDHDLGNCAVWLEGSTWYMLYEARRSSTPWGIGLATASSLSGTWTKSGSNPVLYSAGGMRGGPHIYKAADGTYYLWTQYSETVNAPTDIALWASSDLISWSQLVKPYWYRDVANEGVGSSIGQVADTSIVVVGNRAFFYEGGHATQTADGVINVMTATASEEDLTNVRSPVLLDATVIDSSQPTTVLVGTSGLWVGETNSGTATYRTLLKFDLGGVPSKRVYVAKLRLYADSDASSNARDYNVHRLLVPFSDAEATWNVRLTGVNWATAGANNATDFDSTIIGQRNFSSTEILDAWKEWDLDTDVVQQMIDGTLDNHGFIVRTATDNNDAYRFGNKSSLYLPQLFVVFEYDENFFDTDTQTLINAMAVVPNKIRQEIISSTIRQLKTKGIWSILDELWVFAAHTEQASLLGWKQLSNATKVGTPTFTADRGFARSSGTQYINTNFNPAVDGVNYTQNSASFGVYCRTDDATSGGVDMGYIDTGSVVSHLLTSQTTGTVTSAAINSTGGQSSSNSDSRGLFIANRSGAAATQIYRNGVSLGSDTDSSSAAMNRDFYVCMRNNAGTPDSGTTRQQAMAFVGGSFTAQQAIDFYEIMQAYMTAVGAQV